MCFKVNDATSNNQILGPGSYANGLQATMFDFVKDKGIAYLKADGPGQIVRTVFALDKVESDKVAARARWARKRANRLTGYAAGEELEVAEQEVLLLDELRQVFGTASTMHLSDLVECFFSVLSRQAIEASSPPSPIAPPPSRPTSTTGTLTPKFFSLWGSNIGILGLTCRFASACVRSCCDVVLAGESVEDGSAVDLVVD